MKFSNIYAFIAIVLTVAMNACSKGNTEYKVVTAATPEEAVEIFINGLISENSAEMLSVVGRIDGSALDKATYEKVMSEMDNAMTDNLQILKIKSFKVLESDIDQDVAQCRVEVTYSNDSTTIEENTLVLGSDGGWRLPFFQ